MKIWDNINVQSVAAYARADAYRTRLIYALAQVEDLGAIVTWDAHDAVHVEVPAGREEEITRILKSVHT
jgi:hypothetical protein